MRPVPLIGALLLLLLLLVAPPQQARSTPATEWDPRLDPLAITFQPAQDCSAGCWHLVEARYEDPEESAGLHHVWARGQGSDGTLLAGQEWHLAWPEGNLTLQTKPAPDWADSPLWRCYFPENGPGPYRAYMGSDEARSDVIGGMGLPACHHVSFRLTWQWVDAPPMELEPRLWLPLLER
jgi:hypothetical protein